MKPSHILSILLAAPLAAQTAPVDGRGTFQAIPHFVTTSNQTTLPGLRWKLANDIAPTIPPATSPPGSPHPQFSMAALLPNVPAASVVFDAISSGNDEIPLVGTDELDPSVDGWVAFTYSVGTATTGVPLIDARDANRDGDLFSAFLRLSGGIPLPLLTGVYLEQGHEHMGIPLGVGVRGHDIQMPYIQNGSLPENGFITTREKFFFSLTPTSAVNCSSHPRFQAAKAMLNPTRNLFSGADIFVLTWGGTAWGEPEIFRQAESLGVAKESDVDALAVDLNDLGAGEPDIVLFSLTSASPIPTGLSQLDIQLLVQGDTSNPARPPRDRNATLIRLVLAGEIDAIAVIDPDGVQGNAHVAYPLDDGSGQFHLSLSVANNGPMDNTRHSLYGISISGFASSHQAGPVAIQFKQGPQGTWANLTTVNKQAGQRTVQLKHAIPFQANDKTFVRAMFTVSPGVTLYSWPVYLQI